MYTTGPRGRYYYSDVYYKENTLTAIVITRLMYISVIIMYTVNVRSYACVSVTTAAATSVCTMWHCLPARVILLSATLSL